ncbi:MAG TPA: ABC transporter permease [Chthoniobacterales bacterium]
MNALSENFNIRIRPRRSLWEVDWRGIFDYRDLLFLLVRRDFISKYKQTVLGPAWMLIQPLATTVVFTIIFSNVAKISTDSTPPVLFYMGGLLTWNLFSQNLGGSGNVLQANAGMFGKVYFPRIIIPLANGISALIPFAIQLALFLAIYILISWTSPGGFRPSIGPQLLLLPLFVLQAALVGLGSALIFSSMTAVYRDLQYVLGFLVQIWMYLTPIIMPVSQFPTKWRWLVLLNPMTAPVEGTRWALLGTGTLSPVTVAQSWGISLALFIAGFLWFNKIERSFVDRA